MKNSFYFLGRFNIFPITIRNIFINKFNNLINIINASTKCVEVFVNNCKNLLSYYHTVKLDSVAQQAPQESPLVQVQRRASMFSMIKRFITLTKMFNTLFSFPFPVIFGLIFLWATTSYYGSFIRFPGNKAGLIPFLKFVCGKSILRLETAAQSEITGWDIVLIKTC